METIFVYNGQPREVIPRDVIHVLVHASCVETIEESSFENCRSLLSLKVPGTVKTIGISAFHNCWELVEVYLNEGLAAIGDMAFAGCIGLEYVWVPSTVVTIGRSAFAECLSLLEIEFPQNSRLTSIEEETFCGCQELWRISIPKSVKRIDVRAFEYCISLSELELNEGLVSIEGYQAFEDCNSLTTIRVPKSVTSISNNIFEGCTSLVRIEFPQDGLLTTIGNGTFLNCTALEHVHMPKSVEKICGAAFDGCTSLYDVKLEEGLVFIGFRAFSKTRLKAMTVPSTVGIIGKGAFLGCEELVDITLPPQGISAIHRNTFARCKSLRSIGFPKTVTSITGGAFADCSCLVDVQLNEGLETMELTVFHNCTALSAVVFPMSLSLVQSNIFRGCTNLLSVEIPSESKVQIGIRCFIGCTGIVNISIPASVAVAMAPDAFDGCDFLAHNGVDSLTERYKGLPVHEVCYHSSTSTVSDLDEVIRASDTDGLVDAFGLTSFHVLATSANLKVQMLDRLLNAYRLDVLTHRDKFGNTMLDYLLRTTSLNALSLIQMVLQRTIVNTISGLGVAKWISEVSRHVNPMETDDDRETRRTCVNETFGYFGYCMMIEMTSTVELAMWKRRIRVLQDEDPAVKIDRVSCRLQCGSDVVLDNVVKYLWNDESKVDIGLSVFPLWSHSSFSNDED
mmetsp:Transcript_15367/g.37813  ORF Transcript_15367/g.37813 Transcript_15367/m.37813 type:complete len:680 (+) Transcript_15367:64-2103(+)